MEAGIRRYAAMAMLVLGVLLAGSESIAWGADDGVLHGDYAFTLAESCVQQNNLMPPSIPMFVGIPIPTPAPTQLTPGAPMLADGALTYNGASVGVASFDRNGGFSMHDAKATNIFPTFAMKPGNNPFLFGPAIDFACAGNYEIDRDRNVSVLQTCTIPVVAAFGGARVDSNPFILGGIVSEDPRHLTLTGIGAFVENLKVTNLPGVTGAVYFQRVCTRAMTLDKIHTLH